MGYHYLDQKRANDPYYLPSVEIYQMTDEEALELGNYEDEVYEMGKRYEYRLASMNTRVRSKMIDALIEEIGSDNLGGYYWRICLPGCMPDSDPSGPFKTWEDALKDARETYDEDCDEEIEEAA